MDVPMVAFAAQCTVVKKMHMQIETGKWRGKKKKNTCKCRKKHQFDKDKYTILIEYQGQCNVILL